MLGRQGCLEVVSWGRCSSPRWKPPPGKGHHSSPGPGAGSSPSLHLLVAGVCSVTRWSVCWALRRRPRFSEQPPHSTLPEAEVTFIPLGPAVLHAPVCSVLKDVCPSVPAEQEGRGQERCSGFGVIASLPVLPPPLPDSATSAKLLGPLKFQFPVCRARPTLWEWPSGPRKMLLHAVPGSCDTQHVGLIHSMTGDAYAMCLRFLVWVAVYLFFSSSSSVQGPACLRPSPADHNGFLSSAVSPFHCTPQAPCELGLCVSCRGILLHQEQEVVV